VFLLQKIGTERLLQDLFPSLCPGALQPGRPAEAVELQGGPHPFEQLPPADPALDIPYVFADIVSEGAVIAAADVCIRGCLVVPASRKEVWASTLISFDPKSKYFRSTSLMLVTSFAQPFRSAPGSYTCLSRPGGLVCHACTSLEKKEPIIRLCGDRGKDKGIESCHFCHVYFFDQ